VKIKKVKPKNFAAMSPLLGKGGVHQKSKTSVRFSNRQLTRNAIEDWQKELEETMDINEKEVKPPFSFMGAAQC